MASAAAVGADIARETSPNNFTEDTAVGPISSAILSKDEDVPDNLGEEDEDDDDIVPRAKRRGPAVNGDVGDASDGGDDDDLFGDGGDDDEEPPAKRQLDDEELDSGDDEGRHDRMASEDAQQDMEDRQETFMYVDFGRQPLPEPSDGEMYLMKVPRFLSIEPKEYSHTSFQPPSTDHHSRTGPSATFSAYNTALSTIRWRHSPSNPSEIQSNARILRWSDGSLTLQLASDPTQQFAIDGNPLAPAQKNPVLPTPTSIPRGSTKTDHSHDTYTYLAAPNEAVGLLRITHKITAGLSVLPSADTTDDALERLQTSLAAAVRGKNLNGDGGIEFVKIEEDPELARKKAEVAEREKQRAAKRREAAEARERDRAGRVMGRAGLGRYSGGGLSASMLEDDELGAGVGRTRKPAKARRQRRNSEYSDDEDFGRKRGNFGVDEYDEEDDFIAASDEEEAVESGSDEEDPDEGLGEPKRASPKRERKPASPDEDDEDEDAPQAARSKRRRVVDDEDEDE